jgi:hypothetical protein
MPLPRQSPLTALAVCLLAMAGPSLHAASLLQLALDDDRLDYSTAGSTPDAAWTPQYDAADSVDLIDSARSPAFEGAGESWITATAYGMETVDFMWALEGPEQNSLTFSVDGVVVASCGAAPTARWAYVSVPIPEGAHTLRWSYRQTGTLAGKALLDRVGRPGDPGAGLTSSPWIKAVLGEAVDHSFTTRRPALGWVGYSGELPPGLSMDGATGRITGIPTEAGIWRPSFTIYSQGSAVYYSIGIEVTEMPSIGGALDNRRLTFTSTASDGTSIWQPQRDGGRDRGSCLVAGLPPPVQRTAPYQAGWSSLETSVTGPDFLSYWVRVANGRVSLLLDGLEYRSHGPVITLFGWQRIWLGIPAGVHTITWKYEPFPGRTATAWLDDVRLRSEGRPFITQEPDITPLPAGGFHFTVPSANATAGWAVSGLPAGLSLNTSSGTVSGTPQRRGLWPMRFYLDGPSGDRDEVLAVLNASIPCAEATDLPNSWWRTDVKTGAGWFGQNEITRDGTDAIRSPVIIPGSTASLTTSVRGPGTLAWWWHIPAATAGDCCTVALDGSKTATASITGPTAWKQETLTIPAGHHLVSWRWKPDAAGDPESEAVVVDQVSFAR